MKTVTVIKLQGSGKVDGIDFVMCRICRKRFKSISWTHLVYRHDYDPDDALLGYASRFGVRTLRTEDVKSRNVQSLKRTLEEQGRGWTRARIKQEIKALAKEGVSLSSRNVSVIRKDLFEAVSRFYGAWPKGLTGQRFDGEAGLQHFRNRYYLPGLGRFLSRDSYHGGGGGYEYVASRPTRLTDPSGMVTYDLNPETPDSVPFTLKEGLKKDTGADGKTVVDNAGVKCFCIRCGCISERPGKLEEPPESGYLISCNITMHTKVLIDDTFEHLGPVLDEVYAHEQRHVRNHIDMAKEVGKELEAWEKAWGCKEDYDACQREAERLRAMGGAKLLMLVIREMAHGNPKGPAAGQVGFPVIGTRPAPDYDPPRPWK